MRAMPLLEQTYAYQRPSGVRETAAGRTLALETSGGATPTGPVANPCFFKGFLNTPAVAASAILRIAEVAQTRYYQQSRSISRDPVITANGDRLRMESFSGCCGVYARLDILRSGLDGDEVGYGTTNVDVNTPLRRALLQLGGADPLHLRVGPDAVAATTFDGQFVERKVPLPGRWLRGFAEAQVLAADFTLRAEVPAVAAAALLRSLPRNAGGTRWAVPEGGRLRPVTSPGRGAVCLPAAARLTALVPVLRFAQTVRIYGPVETETATPDGATPVAWEVSLPGMRLTLVLSPGVARGFSGEGGVLGGLATRSATDDSGLISALLAWEPRIDVTELSRMSGIPPARVRAALTVLGTSGQVGYDLAEQAYFHRALPYRVGAAEALNPRLRAARALVAAGAVRIDGELAWVRTDDRTQTVRTDDTGRLRCTCLWWAKYRGGRGPCKHALAVRIVRDTAAEEAR